MARSSAVGPLATDPTAIDFARILSRLEKIILAQDVEGKLQLRTSSLERSRVAAVSTVGRSGCDLSTAWSDPEALEP